MTLTLTILAALAVPAAPAPRPKPLYVATQVGTRLVYEDGDGKEEAWVVARVEQKGGATVVTLDRVDQGKEQCPRDVLEASPQWLSRVGPAPELLKTPVRWLKLPFKPGERWKVYEWHNARSVGEEEVTVGAGTFKALRVEVTIEDNEAARYDFWYAPGVGEVKRVAGGKVQRTLKSFTPAKKP
jgi:hypothetical protein